MKKIIGTGLAIGAGMALYNYLSYGVIDWKREVIITIIVIGLLFALEKLKKKK